MHWPLWFPSPSPHRASRNRLLRIWSTDTELSSQAKRPTLVAQLRQLVPSLHLALASSRIPQTSSVDSQYVDELASSQASANDYSSVDRQPPLNEPSSSNRKRIHPSSPIPGRSQWPATPSPGNGSPTQEVERIQCKGSTSLRSMEITRSALYDSSSTALPMRWTTVSPSSIRTERSMASRFAVPGEGVVGSHLS